LEALEMMARFAAAASDQSRERWKPLTGIVELTCGDRARKERFELPAPWFVAVRAGEIEFFSIVRC
jgi:hypothetical protein